MDPPGSSPRSDAWHSHFQGFKQLTPRSQMLGNGTRPNPGQKEKFNFLSLHDLGQNCASVTPIFACSLRWDQVEGDII